MSPVSGVLHIDTAVEWRGGQRQLELLLRGRPRDLWAGVPGSPLADRLGPPDLALRPHGHPFNVLALRRFRQHYGLAAAHTPHAAGLALLAGAPTVIHRRVDFVPSPTKYRRAKHVIAVSEAIRGILLQIGVAPERVTVVYDGVDLPAAPTGPGTRWASLPRPLYACVGALVAHKGHHHAIAAMAGLPGTLVIAGEGALRSALEHQIARLGLTDRVVLAGQVDDVPGLLAAIDVFLHPSVEEGLGQVVIEAMGAGCRCVVTSAGGLLEVVGDTALIVPPGDEHALGGAMAAALHTPRGRGIARALEFSASRMVEATGEVYRRILSVNP